MTRAYSDGGVFDLDRMKHWGAISPVRTLIGQKAGLQLDAIQR
jgi:hypothetical protein